MRVHATCRCGGCLAARMGEDIRDANKKRLKIEIWDHRLRLSHFRGGCSLLLKDVLDAKRIKNTLRLSGVRHGEISLEVRSSAVSGVGRAGGKGWSTVGKN